MKQQFTFRVRIFTDISTKSDKDSGLNLINSGYLRMSKIIRITVNSWYFRDFSWTRIFRITLYINRNKSSYEKIVTSKLNVCMKRHKGNKDKKQKTNCKINAIIEMFLAT